MVNIRLFTFVIVVYVGCYSITANGLRLKEVGGFSSNALAEADISLTINSSAGQ
jgi:hypothetical protein